MKVRGTDAGLEQYADYFAILRYNLTQDSSQDSSIEIILQVFINDHQSFLTPNHQRCINAG